VNPSGKLPITFPVKLEDSPAHVYGEYKDISEEYKEGLLVGYRYFDTKNVQPLFAFGHGLSYTTFDYDNLTIKPGKKTENCVVKISVDIKNTGKRAGAEVVQLYLHDEHASVMRPFKELKGFEKVMLQPRQVKTVTFTITKQDLSFYDVHSSSWKAELGGFTALVGSSSRDIRMQGRFGLNK
jgi:beta-glucosidase